MNEALRTAVDEAIATRRAWLAVQVDDPNNHPARHDADAKRALAESRAVARFIAWIAEEASNPEQ